MENFGTYLLRTGVISSGQLDEATQSQVIFGGRLGTNLAELGYVGLDDLRKHLSDHLAIPLPNPEWIKHPSVAAREAISCELIEKFRILPLQLDKKKLHLAMMDPRDPIQLDEIAFATGLIVIPYVLPEVQLFALIEHYYGVQRDVRYINLGREAALGNRAGPKSNPKPASLVIELTEDAKPTDAVAGPSKEVASPEPEQIEDLIDEDLFSKIHERRERDLSPAVEQSATPQTPEKPVFTLEDVAHPTQSESPADASTESKTTPMESIATLEARLGLAADRDVVSELALRIARRYADAAALFVARGEIVSGFRGDGDRITEDICGILLTTGLDSSLTAPVSSRVPYRGAAPSGGLDGKILASLGRGDAKEVAVFPILIRGQVVNLLYTDSGEDVLGETGFAALEVLAGLVSCAYERLILNRKSASS
jgi:hypothetical protein